MITKFEVKASWMVQRPQSPAPTSSRLKLTDGTGLNDTRCQKFSAGPCLPAIQAATSPCCGDSAVKPLRACRSHLREAPESTRFPQMGPETAHATPAPAEATHCIPEKFRDETRRRTPASGLSEKALAKREDSQPRDGAGRLRLSQLGQARRGPSLRSRTTGAKLLITLRKATRYR